MPRGTNCNYERGHEGFAMNRNLDLEVPRFPVVWLSARRLPWQLRFLFAAANALKHVHGDPT